MPRVCELIPNPEDLLALEPEEIAPVLLQFICSSYPATQQQPMNRANFFMPGVSPTTGYPPEYQQRIFEVLAASWIWLEREGMLLPAPGQLGPDWVFVGGRGRSLLSAGSFDAYRYGQLLPRRILHPAIASDVFALFIRGHYDTAVFEAFRAVEVAVRTAAGLSQAEIGVTLMRKAFAVANGPLTDAPLVDTEREAMCHLFAAAIGLFKNPTSHRLAAVDKPQDAVDLIMFASYLLRLVDQRSQARNQAVSQIP